MATTPRARTLAGATVTILSVAGVAASTLVLAPSASAATTGTVSVSTQAQLEQAVAAATPGTTISLHTGTYTGGVDITRSGTALAPITLAPAGDGPVTLTAALSLPSCNASSPDPDRTVRFERGASYWTIRDLNIRGGLFLAGGGAGKLQSWFGGLVKSGDWQTRRDIPGRGSADAVAAKDALPYVASKLRVSLAPSDGIKILNNDISLKGIHSAMNRYGTIDGNRIHDIACGVGPGVWLGSLSDGWTVTNNDVSTIAAAASHHMQEGIRVGGGSNYNTIAYNTVHDLGGDGRAFTTDQDGSFNTFTHNTATNVAIGYNDEMSGWGNVWTYNSVTGYRTNGFSLRAMDRGLTSPSMNSSSKNTVVRCNSALGTGKDLNIGASMGATFSANAFRSVGLGTYVAGYWGAQGNTWNGSSVAPGKTVTSTTTGC